MHLVMWIPPVVFNTLNLGYSDIGLNDISLITAHILHLKTPNHCYDNYKHSSSTVSFRNAIEENRAARKSTRAKKAAIHKIIIHSML